MKKFLSILSVLVLVISLTACGGKGDTAGNGDKPVLNNKTVSKYINEKALKNTDNISIVINKVENEVVILNINELNLLNELVATEKSTFENDILKLRIFGRSYIRASEYTNPFFSFKKYLEIQTNVRKLSDIKDSLANAEVIMNDGPFMLLKNENQYEVWAKDNDIAVSIFADGIFLDRNKGIGRKMKTEEEYIEFYNTVKEHFTFARAIENKVTKDDLEYDILDLKTVKLFGEDKSTDKVKDWVFANDLLYNDLKKNGINFATANTVSGSNNFVISQIISGEDKFVLSIIPKEKEKYDFDTIETEDKFSVGGMQFKSRGNETDTYIEFAVKTETGAQYSCDVQSELGIELNKINFEMAKKYIEQIFTDNK